MSETRPEPAPDRDGQGVDRRPLRIDLEIDVGDACPIVEADGPVLEADLHHMDGVCRSDVVTGGEDVSIEQFEQPMGARCLADVFFEHGCVPHVTGTTDDSLLVTIHPPDRSKIPEIVSCVDELGFPARIDRIVSLDDALFGTDPVLCEFGLLTDKQQEALVLAVRHGYYSQPRETTLAELASELGVGKSAVSHRLQAAESKIIRNHVSKSESEER
ncbi:helix-turn-helix domain-containing protein [Halapricum desulfuricans]|uniref:Transcriptional regulator, contains HTH domain n=1 Tax=Halapricum desulfuricans TaxID=2841257 RepID=A0A897MWH8_9EURY|nr:helix-turn-helix domain-containing protein [Halapricum desulfuricans]QSG04942.1 Transcriptional regulator, contains HTH domain [Halapricum desulfuricans]